MKLRHRIWISLALFAAATMLMAAALLLRGDPINNARLASVGGILYWVAIMAALSWWRCPVCNRRIDPPFKRRKHCPYCGKEVDWDKRPRKGMRI